MTTQRGLIVESLPEGLDRLKELDPNVLDSIKRVLLDRHDEAKLVVVENHYVDFDTTAANSMQSARSFLPETLSTQRIHFFSRVFSERKINFPTADTIAKMQSSYLGYLVVRIGRSTTLGRSALTPSDRVQGKKFYSPTRAEFKVSINGVELKVSACPYISQDGSALACATAAVWMSTTPISQKDRFLQGRTTSEITRAALGLDRAYGPSTGAAGLRIDQINDALLKLGYDAVNESYPDSKTVHSMFYGYTESGIPPIVVIRIPEINELHAVTIVGHSLDAETRADSNVNRALRAEYYADQFLIHDDREGMYLAAKIEPLMDEDDDDEQREVGVALVRERPGKWTVGKVVHVITPIPPRVAISYKDALAQGLELVPEFGWGPKRVVDKEVVVRPVLVHSNKYKNDLMQRSAMPLRVRNAFRRLPMPRYIWLIEFAAKSDWSPRGSSPRTEVFGEAILDSTTPDSVGSPILGIHMPGFVQTLTVSAHQVFSRQKRVEQLVAYPAYEGVDRP